MGNRLASLTDGSTAHFSEPLEWASTTCTRANAGHQFLREELLLEAALAVAISMATNPARTIATFPT